MTLYEYAFRVWFDTEVPLASDWVSLQLQGNLELELEFLEVFDAISEGEAQSILVSIAKRHEDFAPYSVSSIEVASQIVLEHCKALIMDEITPFEFCHFIGRMDAYQLEFNDPRRREGEFVGVEMGDLYECCDWCDKTWTKKNATHLYDEASRMFTKDFLVSD
ncbi:MAG: hypothetical protein AAF465_05765 [Pseudomonadota bacterium]